jgi:cellobiose phosphorylase
MAPESSSPLLVPSADHLRRAPLPTKAWSPIPAEARPPEDYVFDDDQPSIRIHRHDLPSPWINYLSNGRLHAFVSQAAGGFLWWKHSSKCRLTRYRMNNLPIDSPGFYIYIRHKDGTVWSPGFRPVETKLDAWSAAHEPGSTEFYARKESLEARLRLFIPPDHDALVWDLEVTNLSGADEEVDIFAYAELSQYNWLDELTFGYYWRHMLKTWFDAGTGALLYLFHFLDRRDAPALPVVYFACSRPVKSYSGDRDAFVGNYRDERNPAAVEKGICGNEEILSGEPCAALHTSVSCQARKKTSVFFLLGAEAGLLTDAGRTRDRIRETIDALKRPRALDIQLAGLRGWWKNRLGKFACEIPDPNAQRQINIWSPVNCIHVSRYERAVNTLASGFRRIGFRDSCQDMMAMTYRDPAVAEEIFLHLLTLQEKEGNARPNDPSSPRKHPDLDVNSDHHLWMPFLAHSYLAETGDYGLLEKSAPFFTFDAREPAESATAWEHMLAGIRYTANNLGAHGLPLTLKGDWNDIIGKFSEGGKGESVFAAQQAVVALQYLIEIGERAGKQADLPWLTELREGLIRSILAHAWNGKWWYRCFNDDGQPVGGEHSEFGKIWINSQSWSVLSGVGTAAQMRSAMDAVARYLQTDVGLMKLYPGFKTWPDVPDPFSGYNPGNGENGAIFCHANTWAIIAETQLGNAERAWKYYNQLVPHNALQKMGLERYKGEPYAWASNIVGVENPKHGWSNVVHITGAAAWMDIAATQYLLGIRPTLSGLTIDPCIPGWDRFTVSRTYRGCQLRIEVVNPRRVSKGVRHLTVNGEHFEGAMIPNAWIEGKDPLSITAVMG